MLGGKSHPTLAAPSPGPPRGNGMGGPRNHLASSQLLQASTCQNCCVITRTHGACRSATWHPRRYHTTRNGHPRSPRLQDRPGPGAHLRHATSTLLPFQVDLVHLLHHLVTCKVVTSHQRTSNCDLIHHRVPHKMHPYTTNPRHHSLTHR